MIRIERRIGWYAAVSAIAAPLWLVIGSTGFAPAAWVGGLAWAWFIAWWIMHNYEKKYRVAMDHTLTLLRSHARELPVGEERDNLMEFIHYTRDKVDSGMPLMKMNRWIGNIEGKLVAYGIVSDGELGDQTRPLFRPLDFGA